MHRAGILVVATSAAILASLAYVLAAPGSTLLVPALVRLPATNPNAREIALTFDDGPAPDSTPAILDVLRDQKVRATFFLCGANAERHPEIVRRIHAEGHQIGNHTYSHPYLHLKSREQIAREITQTQHTLERITGSRPEFFRPPFGVRWFSLGPLLKEMGLTMVMWSGGGPEGRLDARGIVESTLAGLKPGAIVLLHDALETSAFGRPETVKALPDIIAGARRAGYSFAALPRAESAR